MDVQHLSTAMENVMTSYENPTPRALFGVFAVALTALTIGLFAVLPAQTGPSQRPHEIAAATPAGTGTQGDVSPAELRHIEPMEVVATRAPKVISTQDRAALAKRRDQG
jgi:hypothetical protein